MKSLDMLNKTVVTESDDLWEDREKATVRSIEDDSGMPTSHGYCDANS